ncbi:hypothetical protein O7632_05630 [Solwaraspora sp. WMMD406]|uniref:hypothetical protein n=1 Tax=Solwaraspora sp. WMMD406 TaxID=3016095 RepID=UPI0024163413|nr:hypothetical protein [Solwaraspora sp. WMMD406]MDG4763593.1 hypothetical protein [Solwaraspora sp. WMMD406]
MSTLRLAAAVGGFLLALLAGFALGRAVTAPTGPAAAGSGYAATSGDHTHPPGTQAHNHGNGADGGDGQVAGLSLSDSGYTLVPATTVLTAGVDTDFEFQVIGAGRQPVTEFEVVHEKRLHLIVARRDLTGFQHLHPELAPDGTWSVPLRLDAPGIWRVYTDFSVREPGGTPRAMTLGVDLVVAGDYAPVGLPAATTSAQVDDFTVRMEGAPQVGASAPLLFRVTRDGVPVTDLEPYLGAYGHLVALRAGDLGYLHVHPEPDLVDGAVKFWLAAPSPGDYRLFLDFQVAGEVRTAEFTVTVD